MRGTGICIMYKTIHLEQLQVDHYLSDQPVTHYNTSLWRITTAHGKRIPRTRFRKEPVFTRDGLLCVLPLIDSSQSSTTVDPYSFSTPFSAQLTPPQAVMFGFVLNVLPAHKAFHTSLSDSSLSLNRIFDKSNCAKFSALIRPIHGLLRIEYHLLRCFRVSGEELDTCFKWTVACDQLLHDSFRRVRQDSRPHGRCVIRHCFDLLVIPEAIP
jgi:hypothetical protein